MIEVEFELILQEAAMYCKSCSEDATKDATSAEILMYVARSDKATVVFSALQAA